MKTPQANINFHYESIDFFLENEQRYTTWLQSIATTNLKAIEGINYIFCNDEYLLNINKTYLDHDTYTDIITFPYNYDPIESDIYISIDRIKDNATSFSVTFQHELNRVMAHGLLHLIGYNDKTPEHQAEMTIQEEKALESFDSFRV